jgi:hypothetical protein
VPDSMYPMPSRELAERRTQAAPETHEAFQGVDALTEHDDRQ